MTRSSITLDSSTMLVESLHINRKDVVDFFRKVGDPEREEVFLRALEVGTFCLERATAAQELEFVRRQVESLVTAVERRLSVLPTEVEGALLSKIGTADGQVLAPIHKLVADALTATSDRVKEVKTLFNEIDPSRVDSATAKVIRSLSDLLDSNRTESVQATIIAAVKDLSAADGAIATALQRKLESGLEPLREEIDRLAKEIRGRDAAAEALNQTTAKGQTFEEEIVLRLQPWAAAVGARMEHVGADNRPGDVLLQVPYSNAEYLALAIEARDRQTPRGRKAIAETLEAVMVERKAKAAVYLSRDKNGLAQEIGEWAEGESASGSFVACTFDHIITAIRFLIVQKRLKEMRAAPREFDPVSIDSQIMRMRTALDRVRTLNRKTNDIRGCASEIENEAGLLRSEVRDALEAIEDGIGRSESNGKPSETTSEFRPIG